MDEKKLVYQIVLDVWDIAKRYHATAENIIEIGDKVLVVKQVWG